MINIPVLYFKMQFIPVMAKKKKNRIDPKLLNFECQCVTRAVFCVNLMSRSGNVYLCLLASGK